MIAGPRQPTKQGTSEEIPAALGVLTERSCSRCHSGVPGDCAWCFGCGHLVSPPCVLCRRALPPGARACGSCGTSAAEPGVIPCPGCGEGVGPAQGYCGGCGTQARPVCGTCDRMLLRNWKRCPHCSGHPTWESQELRAPTRPAPMVVDEEPEEEAPAYAVAPGNAEALNSAGIRAYEREDYREAVRLFAQAAEADPQNASYQTNLGVAYGELGDNVAALESYRRAIELNPDEVQAYLNIGYIYNERESYEEARRMWEEVIRRFPGSDEAVEARENLSQIGSV